MKKLYFYNEGDEICVSIESIKEMMIDDELTEKTVSEAVIDPDKSYFWCTETGDAGLSDEGTCGKYCEYYKPRNGKSGVCLFHRRCRTPGKEITVKIKAKCL
jgi:hypothetical protein